MEIEKKVRFSDRVATLYNEEYEYCEAELDEAAADNKCADLLESLRTAEQKYGLQTNDQHCMEVFGGVVRSMEEVVAGNSNMFKQCLVRGVYPPRQVKKKDNVVIHIVGWIESSPGCAIVDTCKPLRSGTPREPYNYKVSGEETHVFPGLDYALLSMNLGERSIFLASPDISFVGGNVGVGNNDVSSFISVTGPTRKPLKIPPRQWTLWQIQVINIVPEADALLSSVLHLSGIELMRLPFSNVLAAAELEKKIANQLFEAKKFGLAKAKYVALARLVNTLEQMEGKSFDQVEALQRFSQKVFKNLAITCFKLENFDDAKIFAERACDLDDKDARAWYFRGASTSRVMTDYTSRVENVKEACRCVLLARQLEPSSIEIGAELKYLSELLKEDKKDEVEFCKRITGLEKKTDSAKTGAQVTFAQNSVSVEFQSFANARLSRLSNDPKRLQCRFEMELMDGFEKDYVKKLASSVYNLECREVFQRFGLRVLICSKKID